MCVCVCVCVDVNLQTSVKDRCVCCHNKLVSLSFRTTGEVVVGLTGI